MIAAIVVALVQVFNPVSPAPCPRCYAETRQGVATADGTVTGVVRDITGGVVVRAIVIARSASGAEQETVTGGDGEFTLAGFASEAFELIVRAGGFAEVRIAIAPETPRRDLALVVRPASKFEEVTVAGTRSEQRTADVPASVVVLNRKDIEQSPAFVADDMLRQVPSFSLFRRTSSVAAHPTTQGVSLRGIGPSGVSRTLVLLDGVPFNDPFGGWVYWSRVPLESAERIEIVEGATSNLYGNYAMGGIVSIMTSPPSRRTVQVRTQYGNRASPKVDARVSDVWGKVGVAADVSAFTTDGYATVVDSERGVIDTNAAVRFTNVHVKMEYAASDRLRVHLRTGYFRESRDNGKVTTFDPVLEEVNDTTVKSLSGGVRVRLPDLSDLQIHAFADVEEFDSNNVAVPNATVRDVGRLSLTQSVPSKSWGGMFQWSRPVTGVHLLTGGVDWRWVDGDSHEDGYDTVSGTTVTLRRSSGGTQRGLGLYFQDLVTPLPRMTLTMSARLDRWHNYDGHHLEVGAIDGAPTPDNKPALSERRDSVASPRVAVLYHLTDRVSVWGAAAAGFRAPTLNELYRGFRVGTRQTLANDQLGPERMVGGEGGVTIIPLDNLMWRTTLFDTRVRNPVSNVTIAQSGANVTLQRQNLGRTRSVGLETDVEYRWGTRWRFSGAYLYNESTVTEFNAPPVPADGINVALVGKFLPQVPKHRGSLIVVYTDPRTCNVSVSVQAVGNQFDDDRNVAGVPGRPEAGLPRYAVLGFTVSRPLDRSLEAFVGVQNLLNHRYYVGTLPTLVGSPRFVHAGIRMAFRGR